MPLEEALISINSLQSDPPSSRQGLTIARQAGLTASLKLRRHKNSSVDFLTDSRMISTYAVPPNAIVMVLNGGKDEGTYLNNSVHPSECPILPCRAPAKTLGSS